MFKKKSILNFTLAMLLCGCQNSQTPSTPTQTQLAQLSALISATNYLRDNCNRADIPDNKKITETALKIAKNRYWDIKSSEYINLEYKSKERYKLLTEDGVPLDTKCNILNTSLSQYIEEVKK